MPKIKLTGKQIDEYSNEIFKILKEVPLFYCEEILELSLDFRRREGEDPKLDISDDEESDSSEETDEELVHNSSESSDASSDSSDESD